MSQFRIAFDYMMNNEDRQRKGTIITDEGGVTKYGVSFNFLKHTSIRESDFDHDGVLTEDDVKVMTFAECRPLYEHHFWTPILGDEIVSQDLANKLFDGGVNMGCHQAVTLLQRALKSVGFVVVEDGVFGAKSLAALNAAEPKTLLVRWKEFLLQFRQDIARRRPVSQAEYVSWLRRDQA